MIDLNNPSSFKHLDPKDVYGSTGLLADQCEQIWADAKSIIFPDSYKGFDNIILCGMGGSAYSSYIIQSLFKEKLDIPLIFNNDYDLPAFATKNSLIILSSYSGTTEESLSCASEAISKGLKVTAITNGGQLAELLLKNNMPVFVFDPKNNPSGQPRLGTGYMVLGTISILNNLGLLSLSDEEVNTAINELKSNQEKIKEASMILAPKLKEYFPLIMCSGFLHGNAHVLRNQFNETAKSFAAFEDIPELNHHLMEGFKYPDGLKIKTLFLDSNLYDPKHLKRIKLTEDVVAKNNIESLHFEALGSSKLSQMLCVLSFGGYVTFYLGILYGEDPSLIPWVDYFKDQLKK